MFSCSRSRRWIKKVHCNENDTIFVFLLFWNSWTTGRQHLEGSLAECVRIFVFRKTTESCVLTSTATKTVVGQLSMHVLEPDRTKPKTCFENVLCPRKFQGLGIPVIGRIAKHNVHSKKCEHSKYAYISYVNTQWLHIADCNWVHVWTVHQWLIGFSYNLNKKYENRQTQLKTQTWIEICRIVTKLVNRIGCLCFAIKNT